MDPKIKPYGFQINGVWDWTNLRDPFWRVKAKKGSQKGHYAL